MVIVAGGVGKRFGSPIPKQYLPLGHQSVLEWSVEAFFKSNQIHHMVIVSHPSYWEDWSKILSRFSFQSLEFAPSGNERKDSVANGIKKILPNTDKILIHDAARPFISSQIISNVIASLEKYPVVVVGLKSRDTVKILNQESRVQETIDRSNVFLAQTPQGFNHYFAEKAMELMVNSTDIGTDDVSYAEKLEIPVGIVEGNQLNFKITTQEDYEIATHLVTSGFFAHVT